MQTELMKSYKLVSILFTHFSLKVMNNKLQMFFANSFSKSSWVYTLMSEQT